ncbi:MAG: hypothetical protein ACUVR7_12680 [Armatimonadota bacterium]
MRKGVFGLLVATLLFVETFSGAFADALLRAWANSDNGIPLRLFVHVPREGFPSRTIQTVSFAVQNPLPRRTIHLQVTASYTTDDGKEATTQSNPLVLEIDQTARGCRLYFYVINGYALEDTLSVDGLDLNLPCNSAFVVVPIEEIPAGNTLRGQVKIFAR